MVVLVALFLGALVATVLLLRARTYTASASFTPQSTRSQLGGLGGIAAQFGVAIPAGESNQSPQFYADLLRSRTILEPLVHMPFAFSWRGEEQRGNYVRLSRSDAAPYSAHRAEAALRRINEDMSVGVNQKTGIVKLEITTRYPQLSALLVDSALSLLNSFNVQTRRSQASAQRQFLEQRLATVTADLGRAEEAARDFAQNNRGDLRASPHLMIQQERINREVTMRAQVVGTLRQALEQAKLDEIRDTPLITVTEAPVMPASPDPRGLIVKTILALMLGTLLGSVLAIVRYVVARQRRERPEAFAELSAELSATRTDLMRIVRPRRGAATPGALR